jgi:hypothetical protein
MCPIIIITLSLAILVLMGGLKFLHQVKTDGMGLFSKITSYVAILFGTIVLIGGIVGASMMGCHGSKCGKGHGKCKMEMQRDCGSGHSCKSGHMEHHGMMNHGGKCEQGKEACCKDEKASVK